MVEFALQLNPAKSIGNFFLAVTIFQFEFTCSMLQLLLRERGETSTLQMIQKLLNNLDQKGSIQCWTKINEMKRWSTKRHSTKRHLAKQQRMRHSASCAVKAGCCFVVVLLLGWVFSCWISFCWALLWWMSWRL